MSIKSNPLLEDSFNKKEKDIETKSQAFKRGYNNGYIDAKKGRKKIPHDTRDGYCCACNYDITRFEGELKEMERKSYKKGAWNALEILSACYSPQGGNWNEEVQKDIARIKKVMELDTLSQSKNTK
jgi:hypothetical protein